MTRFDSLPGYYKFLFLYLEPISELGPLITSILWGPSWFYNELTPPTGPPPPDLDVRAVIAIWQLDICFLLIFVITSLVFRAIRDNLSHDLAAQERLTGTLLFSLGVADVTHMFVTFLNLPADIKYTPLQWNTTTHGNLTFVVLLHISRISWFLGIGRKRYYFGQPQQEIKKVQ